MIYLFSVGVATNREDGVGAALKLDREQNPAIMPNIEFLKNSDITKMNIVSY